MSKKYERELQDILERFEVRENDNTPRFRWFNILVGRICSWAFNMSLSVSPKYRNVIIPAAVIFFLFLIPFLPISLGILGSFIYASAIIFLILFFVSLWRGRGGMEKRWRGKKIE